MAVEHEVPENFEIPPRPGEHYTRITTPYGLVEIKNSGRTITYTLFGDIHTSTHHKALMYYYQKLLRRGITQINIAHLRLPGLDKTLDLKRGNAILDLAYTHRGRLYEVELKTSKELGEEDSAQQIEELARHCTNLVLAVPMAATQEAWTILTILKLTKDITLDAYDVPDDEGEAWKEQLSQTEVPPEVQRPRSRPRTHSQG